MDKRAATAGRSHRIHQAAKLVAQAIITQVPGIESWARHLLSRPIPE